MQKSTGLKNWRAPAVRCLGFQGRLGAAVTRALATLLVLVASAAHADVPGGLAWLQSGVDVLGQIERASAQASPEQVRCEVARTLALLAPGHPQAGRVLEASPAPQQSWPTEPLACWRSLHPLGSAALPAGWVPPGQPLSGWRPYADFGALPLATAWVLGASPMQLPAPEGTAVLAWLQARQAADGSFTLEDQPDPRTTAHVLRSLSALQPAAQPLVAQAATYLTAHLPEAIAAQDTASVALILEALHPYSTAAQRAQAGAYLASTQRPDGSWEGDPYTTALALRALLLAGVVPADPTRGGVRLRVTDAATGGPLTGVAVRIQPAPATPGGVPPAAHDAVTDADGWAELQELPAGAAQLRLSHGGYSALMRNLNIPGAQTLQLGELALHAQGDPARGSASGVVRDAATGQPLAGVSITVEPARLQALTDEAGRYHITGVPPGAVTLVALREGYLSASAGAVLPAGHTLDYSPALQPQPQTPPETGAAQVRGVVRASGGALLAGAKVSLMLQHGTSHITYTDAQGKFSFPPVPREIAVAQAEQSGYRIRAHLMYLHWEPEQDIVLELPAAPEAAPLPDLRILAVDKTRLHTDPESLRANGTVTAVVANLGRQSAPAGVRLLAFEDRDQNGRFDPAHDALLGEAVLGLPLEPGQSHEVPIGVSDAAILFRDNAVRVIADAAEEIAEQDEQNNLGDCACTLGLPWLEDFDDGVAQGVQDRSAVPGALSTWVMREGAWEARGEGVAVFGDARWADYDARVRLWLSDDPPGTGEAGLALRVDAAGAGYQLRVRPGVLRLVRLQDGQPPQTLAEATADIQPGRWHDLRAELRGRLLRVYLDDAQLLRFEGLLQPRGAAGLVQAGREARFDDLHVAEAPYFEEDFEGAAHPFQIARFNSNGQAPVSVEGGRLHMRSYGSAWAGDKHWSDYIAQVDLRFPAGRNNDAGLVVLANNPPEVQRLVQVTLNGNLLRMNVIGQGVVRAATLSPVSTDPDFVYRFRYDVQGRTIRVYVNGQFIFDYDELPWTQGAIGFIQDGVHVSYDDFKVWRSGAQRPDLSASRLRLQAQPDGALRLTVRVGNGGHGTVAAGVPLRVLLTQADGSTHSVAQFTTTVALARGAYQDVETALPVTLPALAAALTQPGQASLSVIVDEDAEGFETVAECNEANNSQSASLLSLLAPSHSLRVGLDRAAYAPGDTLGYTLDLGIPAGLPLQAQVALTLVAPDGVVAAVLPPLPAQAPAGVAALQLQGQWPVEALLAGPGWSLRAVLRDLAGAELAAAQHGFAIQAGGPDGVLHSAHIAADRAQYSAAQPIALTARVGNATTNQLHDDLHARILVLRGADDLVYERSELIAQLAPGAQRSVQATLAAAQLPAGAYVAWVQLRDAQASVLARHSANFVVLGAADTGVGLSGQLQPLPAEVTAGQPVPVVLGVHYSGTGDLPALPVRFVVLQPDSGEILASQSLTLQALGSGASHTLSWTWLAQGQPGAALVVAAVAELGGVQLPLGQQPLRLAAPPPPVHVNFGGALQAQPAQIPSGEPVHLSYLLTNPGQHGASASFALSVHAGAGGAGGAGGAADPPLAHWLLQPGVVPAGASHAGNHSYSVPVLPAGASARTYTAVLRQQPAGVTGTDTAAVTGTVLASATFTVVPAQAATVLRLQAARHGGVRLLVLLSCPPTLQGWGEGSWQPAPAECASLRAHALRQTLDQLGVVHKIVTSNEAFRHEMRCGTYNAYWLAGGALGLDNELAVALREQLWHGAGLMADGLHDDVPTRRELHPLMGMRLSIQQITLAGGEAWGVRPGLVDRDAQVQPAPGAGLQPLLQSLLQHLPADTFPTVGRAGWLDLTDGQALAHFAGTGAGTGTATHEPLPALVAHSPGAGRSLALAFDLAAMASGMSAAGRDAHEASRAQAVADTAQALLRAALDHLGAAGAPAGGLPGEGVPGEAVPGEAAPTAAIELHAGASVALALSVTHVAGPGSDARLEALLPAGLEHLDAQPPAQLQPQADGATRVIWQLPVPEGARQAIVWRVRAAQAGSWRVPLALHLLPDDVPPAPPHATAELALTARPAEMPQAAALAAIEAITLTSTLKNSARNVARDAQSLHQQGRYGEALPRWMDAARILKVLGEASGDAQVAAARAAIQPAWRASAAAQCQALACLGADLRVSDPVLQHEPLNLAAVVRNSCPGYVRHSSVQLLLRPREGGTPLIDLTDGLAALKPAAVHAREGSWLVSGEAGQPGQWLDARVVMTSQGHEMTLAAAAVQVQPNNAACRRGQPIEPRRFQPAGGSAGAGTGALAGVILQGGSRVPGGDWEWALGPAAGQATGQVAGAVTGHLAWTHDAVYEWTLRIDAAGIGYLSLRRGGNSVLSTNYKATPRFAAGSQALRLQVQAPAGARLLATLDALDGLPLAPVALDTAEVVAGESAGVAIYQPALADGFAASGTLRMQFTGEAPPPGSALRMTVQPGGADCQ